MTTLASQRASPRFADLIAFAAVLSIGALLVVLGHLTTEELAAYTVAGLFGVWTNGRRTP
ncbi:hypothetical protein GCM10009730_61160 [Streptomyces albidochromogenes]|uniref:hypothetical protein n=1 Tax=Streptomyces albidochromogenes TaxID=329524 RepID=UPI002FE82B98